MSQQPPPSFHSGTTRNIQLNTLSCCLVCFPHQGHNCITELPSFAMVPGDTQKSHSYRALRESKPLIAVGFNVSLWLARLNSKRKLLPDIFLSSLFLKSLTSNHFHHYGPQCFLIVSPLQAVNKPVVNSFQLLTALLSGVYESLCDFYSGHS